MILTEGGRLSRSRQWSEGVQSVPKAVYHSGCRDKYNYRWRKLKLGPLTPQLDSATVMSNVCRSLRPASERVGLDHPQADAAHWPRWRRPDPARSAVSSRPERIWRLRRLCARIHRVPHLQGGRTSTHLTAAAAASLGLALLFIWIRPECFGSNALLSVTTRYFAS